MAQEQEAAAAVVVTDTEDSNGQEEEGGEDDDIELMPKPLQNLVILPPRQQNNNGVKVDEGVGILPLPPLQLEEPVQSIRLALSEVIGYAQITNYRLEIEEPLTASTDGSSAEKKKNKNKSTTTTTAPCAYLHSPFTGPNAVVCVPFHYKSLDQPPSSVVESSKAEKQPKMIRALDIYGDLQQSAAAAAAAGSTGGGDSRIEDGAALRVVLEQYDAASVKEHVLRTRHLLTDGNAPCVVSLVEENNMEGSMDAEEAAAADESENKNKQEQEEAAKEESEGGDDKKEAEETQPPPPTPLPKLPTLALSEAKVDSSNLADYFYLACGEDPKEYLLDTTYTKNGAPASPKSKKKKKSGNNAHHNSPTANGGASSTSTSNSNSSSSATTSTAAWVKQHVPRFNALEEDVHIPCEIKYSGFHPPPATRRFMGDLAYLEFIPPPPVPSVATGKKKSQPPLEQQQEEPTLYYITATTTGFYVNKSRVTKGGRGRAIFDPAPKVMKTNNNDDSGIINKACFSHSLLDCLLQASPSLRVAWKRALAASKERAEILSSAGGGAAVGAAAGAGTLASLFRLAIRGDMPGFATPARAAQAVQHLDASLGTPSWLVPLPRCPHYTQDCNEVDDDDEDVSSSWNRNQLHNYNPVRPEEEFAQTFGVDIRNGGLRDWNEELQLAREMPTSTILERLDRARAIYKAMTEFGEASLVAIQAAICADQNQVVPMNPNEGTRTQVYLHNNIFISRAMDCGPETFRMVKGDGAAKKSASREIQCIKTFSRMEQAEFHTLATVLVDYLGTRYICQSILPGILMGEKSHTVLLGSVDTDLPLQQDEEFKKMVEEKIGVPLNLLSRRIYTSPLTPERREECRKLKKVPPLPAGMSLASVTAMEKKDKDAKEAKKQEEDPNATISTCAPLEAKGIKGSDQRCYLLDFGRMTPRDANWVSKEKGGTGKWDGGDNNNSNNNSSNGNNATIPSSLEDDEWTMNVLRPELINRWIRHEVTKSLEQKRVKMEAVRKVEDESTKAMEEEGPAKKAKKEGDDTDKKDADEAEKEKERAPPVRLTEEEQRSVTDNMKLNVNVFIPDVRVVDEAETAKDEANARDAAAFLWDEILPRITKAIKEGSVGQIPLDGQVLTEFMHRNGVNCRYLGRLATLAKAEETKDAKITADLNHGLRPMNFEQKTMPLCWLDLLECEMVARAAKHVLDRYLTENSGVAASRPLQTIASFLSALVSEREETAAQTETRLEQRSSDEPDEEDFQELTIYDTGGGGDAVPPATRSRTEIWKDIEREVGRRFRYTLTLYNTGSNKSGRALHIPLLRRVCMRTGVRLAARNYDVGGRGFTGGSTYGGRLAESYPISPLDVVDVVPLMKHSAAYHEGFLPCTLRPAIVTPPLQVSLVDAKAAMERAHIQMNARSLQRALELAQEAASLYQRVTENGAHPGVVECMELMATIFLEAGDAPLAAANGAKTLGLAIQSGGFDGQSAFNLHMTLFQMCFAARETDRCVNHLRAAIYLLEIMGGPRHFELAGAYQKLATVYSHAEYKGGYSALALQFYRIIQEHSSCDRVMEGFITKSFAKNLAEAGEYKEAVEVEKRANKTLAMFLGKTHEWVKESDRNLQEYTKLAVQQGSRVVENKKMQEEADKADAVAADLVAAEKDDEKKKKKKKKKAKK